MSKHTKGPWAVEDNGDYVKITGLGLLMSGGKDDESLRANARLIANSPELLAVLKEELDDVPVCQVKPSEKSGRDRCDCWACNQTRDRRALLSRIEG